MKKKQELARKLTTYLGEIKATCSLDKKGKWTFESQEVIDKLIFDWNVFCYNNGFYKAGRLLRVEVEVMRLVTLGATNENELREQLYKRSLKNDEKKWKQVN